MYAAAKLRKVSILIDEPVKIQVEKRFKAKSFTTIEGRTNIKVEFVKPNSFKITGEKPGLAKIDIPRNMTWAWKHRSKNSVTAPSGSSKEASEKKASLPKTKTPKRTRRKKNSGSITSEKKQSPYVTKTTLPKFNHLVLEVNIQEEDTGLETAASALSLRQDKAFFFDDDASNFSLMRDSSELRGRWVSEVLPVGLKEASIGPFMELEKSNPWSFVGESFNPKAGMNSALLKKLDLFISGKKVRVLFLDWDLTITLLQGVFLPTGRVSAEKVFAAYKRLAKARKSSFLESKTLAWFKKALLNHWLSSPIDEHRAAKVLETFKLANHNHVSLVIVTNNKVIADNSDFIKELFFSEGIKISELAFAGSVAPISKPKFILEWLERHP